MSYLCLVLHKNIIISILFYVFQDKLIGQMITKTTPKTEVITPKTEAFINVKY